ncbi:MAG: hypothetical protein AAF843_06130, partial [Bacteroidota bacterium]
TFPISVHFFYGSETYVLNTGQISSVLLYDYFATNHEEQTGIRTYLSRSSYGSFDFTDSLIGNRVYRLFLHYAEYHT